MCFQSTCSDPSWCCHKWGHAALPPSVLWRLPSCLCACQTGDCSSWKLTLAEWLVFSAGSSLAQLAAWFGWRWPAEAAPGRALPMHTTLAWSGSRPRASLCVGPQHLLQVSGVVWNETLNRWLCKEIGSFCGAAHCLGYRGHAAAAAWPAVPKGWRELAHSPHLQLWRAWGQYSGFVSTWRSNYGWKHPQFVEESRICLNR